MAKVARFPNKMETWVPNWLDEEYDQMAKAGLLSKSDHARQALLEYAQARRARIAPRQNGAIPQHHQAPAA